MFCKEFKIDLAQLCIRCLSGLGLGLQASLGGVLDMAWLGPGLRDLARLGPGLVPDGSSLGRAKYIEIKYKKYQY